MARPTSREVLLAERFTEDAPGLYRCRRHGYIGEDGGMCPSCVAYTINGLTLDTEERDEMRSLLIGIYNEERDDPMPHRAIGAVVDWVGAREEP